VVIRRGRIFWADPGEPRGSRLAKRRLVLVIQADVTGDS
jgi:mRNA-degrading endonuclease toxin of MazEF toxin-antitoxin module